MVSQINWFSYENGTPCTCYDCKKAVQAAVNKYFEQKVIYHLNPYTIDYSKFPVSPEYLSSSPVPSQEEINAEWRPWFESLTLTDRKVLARSHYVSWFPLDGGFPENLRANQWDGAYAHLKNPYNYVLYMLDQMPVFATKVTPPCDCSAVVEHPNGLPINTCIVHLNDDHEWTFSQLGDWLDTLGLDLSFSIPEEITEH